MGDAGGEGTWSDESDDVGRAPVRPSSATGHKNGSATRDGRRVREAEGRGGHKGLGGSYAGTARGLDRAVERELSQLKRMFGL